MTPPFDPLQTAPQRTVAVPAAAPRGAGRIRLAGFVLVTALGADAWQSLLGWPAFIVLVVGLSTASGLVLARTVRGGESGRADGGRWSWARLSKPLAAFLVLCVASLAWSQYTGASALGVTAQLLTSVAGVFLAVALGWLDILRALGSALRWLLGLSLLFELFVAVFVGHPVGAVWVFSGGRGVPADYQWSTGSLFAGGPIEGIVGNRNLLAFLVLLALIVFAIEWAEGVRRPVASAVWIGVALLEHGLTRSATVLMATIAVAFVLVIALLMRRVPVTKRLGLYPVGLVGMVVLAIVSVRLADTFFPLLGRSDDLTGRLAIWNTVVDLAWQHPALGWGWISYWAPWVEPFRNLIVIDGTTYLQAHNAWIDVFLQLGFVGVFVFGCLVAATAVRSWWMAIDPPAAAGRAAGTAAGRAAGTASGSAAVPGRVAYRAISLLPLLLLTALVIQSLTESRLLVEGNFLLLVLLATKLKLDPLPLAPAAPAAPYKVG
ncbi:exopolysaccharide production protein [Subtercola sp. Z020]|uniref:O-antigen ligase family protein n=1 Tax=Subtercola sp. Z020 TaxID=2080582 RepID=UPI000CE8935D|nr:O-antigen ligase family protein [Subtercola sp. Z020]PPF82440.1 exopolysaccharide production protein [Subtercola sp. Z020]